MDTARYLQRIGYLDPPDPSLETLKSLHRAHLLAVPFENLDIHLGRPIVLSPAALFEKIVLGRRGGFCYELNGLFAELLRDLGFTVTLLSCGVARQSGGFGPEFDHLALRVDLASPWLADVGFGEGFREPLRMDDAAEQVQDGRAYRIDQGVLYRDAEDGSWEAQYRFSPMPRSLEDFTGQCRYHETSPDSHFKKGRVCTLATPEGRITLSDSHLTITAHGQESQLPVKSLAEFEVLLRDRFGIRYDEPSVLQYG